MPIKDIYSRDTDAPKYNENRLEVSDKLSQLILKIENVLFTRKGDVLGVPGFGCNLEDLIFSLVINEAVIQAKVNSQIQAYCLNNDQSFNVDTRVKFFNSNGTNGALVDIFVNERRVIGAFF
tara:strand:- start:87964 stop:88329 length:366 start_codon:yes stop_codon:yes gene_type:complete